MFGKTVARVLIGSLFFVLAIKSLLYGFDDFTSMIAAKNIMYPSVVALIILITKLVGGFLVMTNLYNNHVITGLITFVVMTTYMYHNAFTDSSELTSMMKNIAVIGGLLLLYKNTNNCRE